MPRPFHPGCLRASRARLLPALLGAALILALSAARAGAAPAPAPVPGTAAPGSVPGVTAPQPMPLDHGWQYSPNRHGHWRAVQVPNVFNGHKLNARSYQGRIGYYRLRFRGPAAPTYTWAVHFGEVRRKATVYLNGRKVGHNRDAYDAFTVDLPHLRRGATNTLLVRVDNRLPPSHGPFLAHQGWWNWGGILRPVTLIPRGRVQLFHLGLMSRESCDHTGCPEATALIAATLHNAGDVPATPRFVVTLRSPTGTETERSFPGPKIPAGAYTTVTYRMPVAHPMLWSPGHPSLYDVEVQTVLGGRVAQDDHSRMGLRHVAVHHGRLYLNGRRIFLSGVSVVEDLPGQRAALTDGGVARIAADVQRLHANFVRAQYPLDPRLLDTFDRMGILVYDEAPVYGTYASQRMRARGGVKRSLRLARRSVLATRSHPSVIIHGTANELEPPGANPPSGRYLRRALRATRRLDPTLPVGLDLHLRAKPRLQRIYRRYDVLGANEYFGWYTGAYPAVKTLRTLHRLYPEQAQLVSEFGAEANRSGPRRKRGTYAFQKHYLAHALRVMHRLPWLSGFAYFSDREFEVKPGWRGGIDTSPHNALHHKGLITYHGRLKPAGRLARRRFAHTPLYR
jgi:beta-glucuronidase